MSAPGPAATYRRSLAWRAGRRVAALGLVYAAAGWLFAFETASRGLLSPGTPHVGVVLFGIVYLMARIAFRFALPAVVTYVCVDAVFHRFARRRVEEGEEMGR